MMYSINAFLSMFLWSISWQIYMFSLLLSQYSRLLDLSLPRSRSLVSKKVTNPWELGFEACFCFKGLQQSQTSVWHISSPFTELYIVSITIGPQVLHGVLPSYFHPPLSLLQGFTTSIGLQHFRTFLGFHASHGGSMTSTATHVTI